MKLYDENLAVYDNLDNLIVDFSNENSGLHRDNSITTKEMILEACFIKFMQEELKKAVDSLFRTKV